MRLREELPWLVLAPPAASRRVPRWLTVVTTCVVVALNVAPAFLAGAVERGVAQPPPAAPTLTMSAVFGDQTPLGVTITADWQKVDIIVPMHALHSDATLWRRMHFNDWDAMGNPPREGGLTAMLNRYRHVIANPRQWDRMNAHDWDSIPQPIRAMAYLQMVKYWSGYYQVGARFGLPRGTVTSTLGAIVMAESWFEHRAVHTNSGGDRDVGLGGFSEYCRRTLRRLAADGSVDFSIDEKDYVDPWRATRLVAVWFDLMLQEAGGQLDMAVRAYHRGWPRASRGEGQAYLANVRRLRRRYIRNEDSSPAWDFLFVRSLDEELIVPAGSRVVPICEAPSGRGSPSRVPFSGSSTALTSLRDPTRTRLVSPRTRVETP
jgi:hypothetical protein